MTIYFLSEKVQLTRPIINNPITKHQFTGEGGAPPRAIVIKISALSVLRSHLCPDVIDSE